MQHLVKNTYNRYYCIKHLKDKLPIIACKRPEFNYYFEQIYDKEIKIASQDWLQKRSISDYFTIYGHGNKKYNEYENIKSKVSFKDIGLRKELLEVISRLKYTSPTDIQAKSFKPIIQGQNVILTAESGCGKTLAYLLPIIQNILQWKPRIAEDFNNPLAVVITPSRELGSQIGNIAQNICEYLNIDIATFIGDHIKQKVKDPPVKYCDLVISSLGSYSKLVTTGVIKTGNVRHIVLDEVNTLLEDGFIDKLTHLLKKFPTNTDTRECQISYVSATFPHELPEAVKQIVKPETLVNIRTGKEHRLLPHVQHRFLRIGNGERPSTLVELVQKELNHEKSIIIFTNKRDTCDYVSQLLAKNNIECVGYSQNNTSNWNDYIDGKVNVLCCTDLVAGGLDTTRTSHVINYELPFKTADYIRRAGRTGRMGSPADCAVTSFASSQREIRLVQQIELSFRRNLELPNVEIYKNPKNMNLIDRYLAKS